MSSIKLIPKKNEALLADQDVTIELRTKLDLNEKVLAGWTRKDAIEAIVKSIALKDTNFIITLHKND